MIKSLLVLTFPIWSAVWQAPFVPSHNTVWMPPWEVRTSRFDPVFRYVARCEGYDWRLVSAIARAESRYDPEVVSRAGAVGLMQVMPHVALRLGASVDEAMQPMVNVELAVAHLDEIAAVLRFPPRLGERDRLSIIMAAYNSGLGHVLDARRLAVKYGENYNSWAVVAKYLELLALPEYFEDEVVRAGPFHGARQTRRLVGRVWRFYNEICASGC